MKYYNITTSRPEFPWFDGNIDWIRRSLKYADKEAILISSASVITCIGDQVKWNDYQTQHDADWAFERLKVEWGDPELEYRWEKPVLYETIGSIPCHFEHAMDMIPVTRSGILKVYGSGAWYAGSGAIITKDLRLATWSYDSTIGLEGYRSAPLVSIDSHDDLESVDAALQEFVSRDW